MRRLPVQQAHADDGDAERARRLEELTGDSTEAAGVNRQRVREGELRGEKGHLEGAILPVGLGEPGLGAAHLVGDRVLDDRGGKRREIRVGRQPLLHGGAPEAGEQTARPLEQRTARPWGRGARKGPRGPLPGPPQVRCHGEEVFVTDDLLA